MTGLAPGPLVRRAGARAAGEGFRLDGGGLSPESTALVKRPFHDVHMFAHPMRERPDGSGRKVLIAKAAADARTAWDEVPGADEPNASTVDRCFRSMSRGAGA